MKHGTARLVLVLGLVLLAVVDAAMPRFVDVSRAKGLLPLNEVSDWRLYANKYQGMTVADLDGDGFYELYCPNHGNNAELYWSNGARGFTYVDPRVYKQDTHGSVALDLNGDKHLDIIHTRGGQRGSSPTLPTVIETFGKGKMKQTQGQAFFVDLEPMRGRSIAAFDFNGNGLDDVLFVNQFIPGRNKAHLLYKRRPDGKLKKVSNTGMEGVAGLWFDVADLNNDGRLDLVFLKYTGVEVWKNMGNYKFKPSTILPRQETIKNVRAMVQFDYDNDGDLDLYFVRGSPGRSIPNTFYENVNGKYVDRTRAVGLVLGGYNVHVTAGDFNNDGCVDLYVTVRTDLKGRQDDKLMLNNCDKTFTEVPAGRTGMKSRNMNEDGDNVHAVDVQMDGKLDIISGSMNSTWRYYKNTTPTDNNHWIIVRVGAPRPSRWNANWLRSEMGALVRVFCGDQIFTQRINSPGRSHSASHYNMLHFGLGKCTKVKKITVQYVNGIKVATSSTLVDRIKNVGLFFRCPIGFEGAQCKKRVPGCSGNRCPRMGLCEIYTRGNQRRYCKLPG